MQRAVIWKQHTRGWTFFFLFGRSVSKREGPLFQITIVTKRVDGGESSFFSLHHLSFVRNVRFTKSNEKRKKTQRAWNREHREGRLRTLTEYFLTLYISSLRSLSTLSGGGSPFKKCRKQQETFKEHKNTLTVLHHPKDFKNIYAYPFKKKSLSK